MKTKYKIIEENEDKKFAVIEKQALGIAKFTINQVENEIEKYMKVLQSNLKERDIHKITIERIEEEKPAIKEMDKDEVALIAFYAEAQIKKEELDKSIEIVEKAIEEYRAELKEIDETLWQKSTE